MSEPRLIKWTLDTRTLWPEAKETKDLETASSQNKPKPANRSLEKARRALSLLTGDERASVARYYFLKDAKLALASALLKRHVVSSTLGIPFAQATPSRGGKPAFRLPDSSEPLVFNVSHQAGLVVLVAALHAPGVAVGVDVVCPGERRGRDHELVVRDGWSRYVDMHEGVFAEVECVRLREMRGGRDELLAYFYALWCLREGFVKMTGEALLAAWLGELEMRHFAPPGEGGELEVWLRGERVRDVDVRLEWYLADYMVCTVVRGDVGVDLDGAFEALDLGVLLDAAERSNSLRTGEGAGLD
ncbi:hypothetical protein ED733_005201 [Metarhizium rileyi]|uniref:holo-[acyl-carrier-protein] synthase n=1 Tax=Metarhizium rileyi (strain RCEF 4871) TaxID=1649241 RepID=A0A5C6GCZ2_METRR|nr:hypothetical protein ED733_005201 [Metarhizium rileyi]